MGSVGEKSMKDRIASGIKKAMPKSVKRMLHNFIMRGMIKKISQTEIAKYCPEEYPWGINLIGPVSSATGLGQSFRLIERVVEQLHVPYLIYEWGKYTPNKVDTAQYQEKMEQDLHYGINLWHVNPAEFPKVYKDMTQAAFDGRYNIAFWLWELEDFPDEWVPCANLLDEIWTPSEFISRSLRKKIRKPVYTIPYFVTAEADTKKYGRDYFNLPKESFLFLMMYDVYSIQERKNPEGVIRAFQEAFPPDRMDVGLVIKINSADRGSLQKIRQKVGQYTNVYLIQDNLEKIQVNSLIADCNVLVSLHRAEGFGLTMAEAMLNHVPVIATDWSANTEFMNQNTACMVGYELVTLKKNLPPYKKGNHWAEPDIAEAAAYMKRLAEDSVYYKKMSENGYAYVQDKLGMESVCEKMTERLQDIRNG